MLTLPPLVSPCTANISTMQMKEKYYTKTYRTKLQQMRPMIRYILNVNAFPKRMIEKKAT